MGGRDIFIKLLLKKLILMSKIYATENLESVLTSTESQIKCYSKSQTVRTELATRNGLGGLAEFFQVSRSRSEGGMLGGFWKWSAFSCSREYFNLWLTFPPVLLRLERNISVHG